MTSELTLRRTIEDCRDANGELQERIQAAEALILEQEKRIEDLEWAANAFMELCDGFNISDETLKARGIWESLEKLDLI